MNKLFSLLNRKHVAPFALLVFVVFTFAMAWGCILNYQTTNSALATRMPAPNALGATVAIQITEFAIPLLIAFGVADFFGLGVKSKVAMGVVWVLVEATDFGTAYYYFLAARTHPDWFDRVIAIVNGGWYLGAEIGVAMGLIAIWIAYKAMVGEDVPEWFKQTKAAVRFQPTHTRDDFQTTGRQNAIATGQGTTDQTIPRPIAQVYVPVPPTQSDNAVDPMEEQQPGEPRRAYLERVRPSRSTRRNFRLTLGSFNLRNG